LRRADAQEQFGTIAPAALVDGLSRSRKWPRTSHPKASEASATLRRRCRARIRQDVTAITRR